MGLFNHPDDSQGGEQSQSNHTCPNVSVEDPDQVPIINGLSFHDLVFWISLGCMGISYLLSFHLIIRHATHFSIPKEQKQVIRIIFIIPVFAIISFLSIAFDDSAIYLKPLSDLYESFALAAFFLLLCTFVQEDDEERNSFIITSGVTRQYMAATIGAFQFPAVMLIVTLVTEITEVTGSYCATSNKPYFAHIWLTVITAFSTTIAILSVLKFYKAVKLVVKHRRPVAKLAVFKGIVFLNFLQQLIFSLLASSKSLNPTPHYTYHDLSIGLPNLILSLEMVIFAFVFLYVYRVSEYRFKSGASAVPLGHGGYQGGLLGFRAVLHALNIFDIVAGMASVPGMWFERRKLSDESGRSGNENGNGSVLANRPLRKGLGQRKEAVDAASRSRGSRMRYDTRYADSGMPLNSSSV